jgi:DNA-binding Xre family transcriptional regulator
VFFADFGIMENIDLQLVASLCKTLSCYPGLASILI